MFRREKKHVERLGRRQISEKSVSSLFVGCLGLFIALGVLFEVATKGRIKSDGSRKFAVY